MNEIILHVGTHKTGSTSIQKTLHCFREELYGEGVKLYEGINHIEFYRGFTDKPSSFHRYYRSWDKSPQQQRVRNQIKKSFEENKGYVHVVSAEDISLLSQASLVELRKFLQEDCGFDKVSIVCFLREPLDYLNSSLQQYIKPGMTSLDDLLNDSLMNYRLQGCPDFRGGSENILRQIYFPIPGKLIDAFDFENVLFFKFEEAIRAGITKVFLRSFLPESPLKWLRSKVSNESMSHEACMLLAEYNDRNPLFLNDYELNEQRVKDKKVLSVLRKIEGRSPKLIDVNVISLDFVNREIAKINSLVSCQLMTPVESIPEKYADNGLFMFSGEALNNIKKLVGSHNVPFTLESHSLKLDELRELNGLIEKKCLDRGSFLSRFFRKGS